MKICICCTFICIPAFEFKSTNKIARKLHISNSVERLAHSFLCLCDLIDVMPRQAYAVIPHLNPFHMKSLLLHNTIMPLLSMGGMARLNPKYTLERIERIKFTSFIAFFKLHFLRLGMPFAKKYA